VLSMTKAAAGGPRRRRLVAEAAWGLLGLAAFVGLWWASIALLVPPDSFLARFAPGDALGSLAQLVASDQLSDHIAASLRRIAGGLALAVAVGIPLGLAIGSIRTLGLATGPVFAFVRMISPLAWTPLAIILFGVGDAPVYFLIAVGATWPIVLNTASGVAGLERGWLLVAHSLGASRPEILRHVVWPGIRGQVLTGLRLATGVAWIILVPAEMLGVDSGLGYFILDARDRFAYDELLAAIIVIGALGFAIDLLARRLFAVRRRVSGRRSAARNDIAKARPRRTADRVHQH
jgi:NitT/TauT family transport system permease protein